MAKARVKRPPKRLSELLPRSGERALVIGQTGSGKSFALKQMLGAYVGKRQIIVLDSKWDPIYENIGAKYVYSRESLTRVRWPRDELVIYRPSGEEATDMAGYDDVFEWVFKRGNTVFVVDEVTQVVPGALGYGPGFADLVTRGRVRGVITFYGTQRPSQIPVIVYSESQRFFVFYVVYKKDREKIASFSSEALISPVPDKHGFWYYDTHTRAATYFAGLEVPTT